MVGGDSYSLGYSGFPTPRPGVGGDPSHAGDDGQPGLGLMRIDRDVDLGGLDGVHRPPLGETVAYLFLPDAARSPVTSLAGSVRQQLTLVRTCVLVHVISPIIESDSDPATRK